MQKNKFLSVIDIFKSNFESKQEHGAQFCAYKNGELILDLHGGWADKKKSRAISPSTLFPVFSSGKGGCLFGNSAFSGTKKFEL